MPKGLRPGVPPCPLEPWSLSPHKLNVSCVGYASLSVESIALSSGDNSYRIEDLSWNPGTVTRIIDTATAFSSSATPTAAQREDQPTARAVHPWPRVQAAPA